MRDQGKGSPTHEGMVPHSWDTLEHSREPHGPPERLSTASERLIQPCLYTSASTAQHTLYSHTAHDHCPSEPCTVYGHSAHTAHTDSIQPYSLYTIHTSSFIGYTNHPSVPLRARRPALPRPCRGLADLQRKPAHRAAAATKRPAARACYRALNARWAPLHT